MITIQLETSDPRARAALRALLDSLDYNVLEERQEQATDAAAEPEPALPGDAPNVPHQPEPVAPPEPATLGNAEAVVDVPSSADLTALDKRGVPYDSRIHTANRSNNQDGSWRYKPRIDRAEAERIEAELKALAAPVRTTPEPEPEPVAPPAAAAPAFGQQQQPAEPVAPPPPPVMPPAAIPQAAAGVDFAGLMCKIGTEGVGDKAIAEALNIAGVPSLLALGVQQDKVGAVYAALFPNG